jgi:hypothetical protein
MEEHKQCPDCAERVLAEARVCRFCGYRFDGGRRDARRGGESTSATGALAGLLRRPQPTRSLPEVLENWGLELDLEETVTHFGYCKLDRAHGFLLITTARLAFFAGRSGDRLLDWPLSEIRAVERATGWYGGRLLVTGADRSVLLRRLESRQTLDDVARLLENG